VYAQHAFVIAAPIYCGIYPPRADDLHPVTFTASVDEARLLRNFPTMIRGGTCKCVRSMRDGEPTVNLNCIHLFSRAGNRYLCRSRG